MTPTLTIENALLQHEQQHAHEAGHEFFTKYWLLRERLTKVEYAQAMQGFPGGNDHGPQHIFRVLSYLDLLLGKRPLDVLGPYELFLAMMSVLYHDVGILLGRDKHAAKSAFLLSLEGNDYVFDDIDKELMAVAVCDHSSSQKIEEDCASYPEEYVVRSHIVRIRSIAALVRLADELDEDERRAPVNLENKARLSLENFPEKLGTEIQQLPAQSQFFWAFNQRVRGVTPYPDRKQIAITVQFKPEDPAWLVPYPASGPQLFIRIALEKLLKINKERAYCNRFLPDRARYQSLELTLLPLKGDTIWKTPWNTSLGDATTLTELWERLPSALRSGVPEKSEEIGDSSKGDAASAPEDAFVPPGRSSLTPVDALDRSGSSSGRESAPRQLLLQGQLPTQEDLQSPSADEQTNRFKSWLRLHYPRGEHRVMTGASNGAFPVGGGFRIGIFNLVGLDTASLRANSGALVLGGRMLLPGDALLHIALVFQDKALEAVESRLAGFVRANNVRVYLHRQGAFFREKGDTNTIQTGDAELGLAIPISEGAFADVERPERLESVEFAYVTHLSALLEPAPFRQIGPLVTSEDISAPLTTVTPAGRLTPGPSTRMATFITDSNSSHNEDLLDELVEERDSLLNQGRDVSDLNLAIVELKRRRRSGRELNAGDYLGDGERFRLDEILGHGGFATVWKAYDRTQKRVVAIKILHGQWTRDQTRIDRFNRGVRVIQQLGDHSYIVQSYSDCLQSDGYWYFVMRYIEGGDLGRVVLEAQLDDKTALDIIIKVSEALHHAHGRGILHRDVKPHNILLTKDFEPRLTDFDLAQVAGSTGGTRTGALGTFLYIAPEVMKNAQEADERSDVYSLGMTLLFALHGIQHHRDLPWDLVMNQERALDDILTSLSVRDDIKGIIRRAVAIPPSRRFLDMKSFGDALKVSLGHAKTL